MPDKTEGDTWGGLLDKDGFIIPANITIPDIPGIRDYWERERKRLQETSLEDNSTITDFMVAEAILSFELQEWFQYSLLKVRHCRRQIGDAFALEVSERQKRLQELQTAEHWLVSEILHFMYPKDF